MQFNQRNWLLQRYPNTKNRSLRPWNAADELLLAHLEELPLGRLKISIINDSHGALSCALNHLKPYTIIQLYSQLQALRLNYQNNNLSLDHLRWGNLLRIEENPSDCILIKVPKSLELFDFYLKHIQKLMTAETHVLCGFMTRNFSPNMISIAKHYFEDVSQSKAQKKARLMILKNPKSNIEPSPDFKIIKNSFELPIKQYPGVFSSHQIDYGTQLLLKHIPYIDNQDTILDLACGNGVIASFIRKQNDQCTIHLLDDNYLALASAKLNISKSNTYFHWKNEITLQNDIKFNLILCNPPFHFEHENTIEIALSLFAQAKNHLTSDGQFMIVANLHLNYTSHLQKLFNNVQTLEQNDKFEVICCRI